MSDTLADIAVETLRSQIFSGKLAPDSRYTETELARRLGLSRTPLREAALRLQAAGLVAVEPRRGITIRSLSVAEMADIYEVLTALEVVAAGRAADRVAAGENLMLEIAALSRAIGNMRHMVNVANMAGWAEADEAFHRQLVALGGNAEIVAIFDRYTDQVRRARLQTLRHRPAPSASNDDHGALVAAIEAGDRARAEALHGAHLRAARALLLDLIRSHGDTRI